MNIILFLFAVLVVASLIGIGCGIAYGSVLGVILGIIGACLFMGLGFMIKGKMNKAS
ncbi:hypothetical protein JOD45_001893 [Scopulibacillus daqui]|uniref:DUF2207 domain-containing protein n=1 Tax=Scopulibacillus daqui TaxID=1469162 RepID=A0ABS2Q046_9BACL|nr:DUF5325 family protein [Scopulibacillus daqui]MBM7645674.1 hypothetical protein [Scopulibacillus daqui]